MTSRLGVNRKNSRNIQRMMQILHFSHNARANNAKFATFAANTRQVLFSYTLWTGYCIYFAYMHPSCTMLTSIKQLQISLLKPYLMLNINVCYPPPVISGPIALIKLNTHKKKKKKKKPAYCQLIALSSNV